MPQNDKPKPNHIEVATVTTAGTWPADGYNEVPVNQPVRIELDRVAKEFKLTDTAAWVAAVDGKEIDVGASYTANNLTGQIEIHWGPREGGGGNRR